jgi:hypothetical protein
MPSTNPCSGLSNQVFILFTTLYYMLDKLDKKQPGVVYLGPFNTDMKTGKRKISMFQILDPAWLREMFPHVHFVDAVSAPVVSAQWGASGLFLDVTENLRHKDISGLVRGKETIWSFVPRQKDPCRKMPRKLILTWENGPPTELQEYDDGKMGGLVSTKHRMFPTDAGGWEALNNCLRCVRFHPSFYSLPYPRMCPNRRYAVVHLRNEVDAIRHWAAMNKMSTARYKTVLDNLYIHAIQKHVPMTCDLMVLTAEPTNNTVIMDLGQQGRTILICDKAFPTERELCAIQDLLWTTLVEVDVLIAPIKGSTFSHWLYHIIRCKTKITMDLDKIHDNLVVEHGT